MEQAPKKVKPRVYFISGPTNLTQEEFDVNYKRKIVKANADYPGCKFILGGTTETDHLAQAFLRRAGIISRVTVCYHEGSEWKNLGFFNEKCLADEGDRILWCTHYSTHDIVWKRDDAMDPTVTLNLARRREKIDGTPAYKNKVRQIKY